MKYIILFEDNPDSDPNIRKTHMSRHLAFLEQNKGKVEAAGPLADPENKGRDGLWILEADSQAEIEKLVHEDPFWPTGLRQSYAIIPWTQVFAGCVSRFNVT
ncbi:MULTISPECIES: YciI family protein [unclassified Ruegeria]|uniref:YciI family protein n=1 Tax=unclassified Ruegeria TaxID=2625375 RepID=UPI001489288C|nr:MULTISPECIES: YciI family protein [unclassified Ruegeria]